MRRRSCSAERFHTKSPPPHLPSPRAPPTSTRPRARLAHLPSVLAKIATDKEEFQEAATESPGLATELWRGWKTGAGMFCESYFIFAIGNVPNIWKDMYGPT